MAGRAVQRQEAGRQVNITLNLPANATPEQLRNYVLGLLDQELRKALPAPSY